MVIVVRMKTFTIDITSENYDQFCFLLQFTKLEDPRVAPPSGSQIYKCTLSINDEDATAFILAFPKAILC